MRRESGVGEGAGRKRVTLAILNLLRLLFPGGSVVKNPPVNVGDSGSIPGSGREKEMATHSSILARKIP